MPEVSFDAFAGRPDGGNSGDNRGSISPEEAARLRDSLKISSDEQATRDSKRLQIIKRDQRKGDGDPASLQKEIDLEEAKGTKSFTPSSEVSFDDFSKGGIAGAVSPVAPQPEETGGTGLKIFNQITSKITDPLMQGLASIGDAAHAAHEALSSSLADIATSMNAKPDASQRTQKGKIYTAEQAAQEKAGNSSAIREAARGQPTDQISFWDRPAGKALTAAANAAGVPFAPITQAAETFATKPITQIAAAAQGLPPDTYENASRPMADMLTMTPLSPLRKAGIQALRDVDELRAASKVGGENRVGYPEAPPPEPYPPQAVQAAGPAMTAKQQIETSLGIQGEKERAAFNKSRQADVRAAFKDDPDYANYLNYLADERMNNSQAYSESEAARIAAPRVEAPATPKVKMTEGTVLGEEPIEGSSLPTPPALDTAIKKVSAGQAFDLTAEEKIALDSMKREPSRIVVPTWTGVPKLDAEIAGDASKAPKIELPGEVTPPETPPSIDLSGKTPMMGRGRIAQGEINPLLLARMAAAGLGGVTGAKLDPDNPLRGALLGVAAGSLGAHVAMKVRPSAVIDGLKSIWAADKRISVKNFMDAHETGIAQASRFIWQFQNHIESLVPSLERRNALTHAIESGDLSGLTPKELSAANLGKEFFTAAGKQGLESGVLQISLNNYVTHLWGKDEKTKGILEEMFANRGTPSMSPESRFAQTRTIPSLAMGKSLGMTPETEDLSTIIGMYGNSLYRAMENKKLIEALKSEELTGQTVSVKRGSGTSRRTVDLPQKLVMPSASAPEHFVDMAHPQLTGMRVHPDIKPALQFVFDNSDPGAIMNGLLAINSVVKRIAVSLSLFHAKALFDAAIATTNNPTVALKMFAQSALPNIFGETAMRKILREGGAGDLVDKAMLGGVKVTLPKMASVDEDTGQSFYAAMKGAQKVVDAAIPGAGKVVDGAIALNHGVDKFMWENLHASLKLNVFAEKYEKLLMNNAKAHARDARIPLRSEKDIAEIVGAYTNDIFGGLNWRRMAEEFTTKWGRDIAMAAYSPKGRRALQLLFFAPDWTISTTRAMKKAFTEGSPNGVLRGFVEPLSVGDLHRQQLVRSAVYYGIVGDTLNYAMSGHHIWENKDPTVIDMGDGRTMQWSKHTMEPVHWLIKPIQQGLNKLGFIPREAANQVMGTEYLAPREDKRGNVSAGPRMKEGRILHVAKNLAPISANQAFEGDATSGIAGFFGVPIYGKTNAAKAREAELRSTERRMKR